MSGRDAADGAGGGPVIESRSADTPMTPEPPPAEPTAAPDVVELLEHAESGGGGDVQGWSATGGTDMALTLAHESTELSMYSIPLGGDLPEDDGGVQDGDPRLDPMAHSFPWARPLIPLNLRSVIPEAAQRVSPDRKLQMLPFKVRAELTLRRAGMGG